MNPIRNPFSRDEYPALTDAINGVVNGQPRPVEEDLQTPERAAEMGARKKKAARHSADAMKRNPEGAGTAAIVNSEIDLRIKDKRERDSKKTYGKGGKVVRESASPQGGDKKPFNPFNPTLGDLLKSKQQDKKADAKTKGVKEEVTPKRMEVLNRAVKTGMSGAKTGYGTLGNAQSRALADRASLAINRAYATKGGKKVTGFDKAKREHEEAKARHKTLKSTPAGFNESQELDERLVGGADFLQASKNLLTGKGFKTNREVSGARVNANMAAMQRRKARAAKTAKKTK